MCWNSVSRLQRSHCAEQRPDETWKTNIGNMCKYGKSEEAINIKSTSFLFYFLYFLFHSLLQWVIIEYVPHGRDVVGTRVEGDDFEAWSPLGDRLVLGSMPISIVKTGNEYGTPPKLSSRQHSGERKECKVKRFLYIYCLWQYFIHIQS